MKILIIISYDMFIHTSQTLHTRFIRALLKVRSWSEQFYLQWLSKIKKLHKNQNELFFLIIFEKK